MHVCKIQNLKFNRGHSRGEKGTKKTLSREYSRGCVQYGSLPPDGLDKIYLHSSAITNYHCTCPPAARPTNPQPLPTLPVLDKQSDTVLTVETLGLRLTDMENSHMKVEPRLLLASQTTQVSLWWLSCALSMTFAYLKPTPDLRILRVR